MCEREGLPVAFQSKRHDDDTYLRQRHHTTVHPSATPKRMTRKELRAV
jgi:hypothetical protein